MFKHKVYIFTYLNIILSLCIYAAPLDKYYVPQQKVGYSKPPKTSVSESVYIDFKNKIRGYSQSKKDKMKEYYRRKMGEAVRKKNFNAASYYERLIGILNSK